MTWTDWKDLAAIVESIATVAALIVGAVWSYLVFVRQRLGFPRLELSIAPQVVAVPGGRIIHAAAKLQNTGSVLVQADYAELRLRQIVPLPEKVRDSIDKNWDPVVAGKQEIEWPMLACREWNQKCEIEPGESETLDADFFVPGKVEVIEFYLYVPNQKKKRLGWPLTVVHELQPNVQEITMSKDLTTGQREPQQRQVPQQPKQQPQQQQQQEQDRNQGKGR